MSCMRALLVLVLVLVLLVLVLGRWRGRNFQICHELHEYQERIRSRNVFIILTFTQLGQSDHDGWG
jgi:hypothetical protein